MNYLKDILLYREDAPLLFTSLYFWLFFVVLFLFFCFLYKKKSLRTAYLFLMSLFFYYKSGGSFFILLIFSTVMDYYLARMIYGAKSRFMKNLGLCLSVFVNLSLLAYFKYSYWLVDFVNTLFHSGFDVVNVFALTANRISGSHFDVSEIILPVGISFYTFQTISYTVDVYRNKLIPLKNIIDYGFFVSFFPQLIAGPIVRAAAFIPQIYEDYKLTIHQMGHAIFMILNGLVKKMVISDYISLNFVDRVFDQPASYSGFENLMAVYGYAIQIYCDFSGYTDIAIGVALLLGFRLPINFNSPYKAIHIADFWNRWHISLTSWFRDYLFLPASFSLSRKLKKNRYLFIKTEWIIYFKATLITFLLCGLWHGANIRFIIWGGMHGLWLALHKVKGKRKWFNPKRNWFFRFLAIAGTFHFVCFTWMFFRAESMQDVFIMLDKIAEQANPLPVFQMIVTYKEVLALIVVGYIFHWMPSSWKEFYRGFFIRLPISLKVVFIVIIVFIICQIKSSEIQPFIYFQF